MLTLVPNAVEAYAVAHTSPVPDVYERLREVTYADTECPQMQVGPLEGRLLKLLVQLVGATRAVEVGTFTGYSSLSIAEGLAEGGTLVTCDVDADTGAIAQAHFDTVPWGARIERRLGPAAETLAAMAEAGEALDFAFIDADKTGYITYWDLIVPMLRPGGVVVVDNVLWSGNVLDPQTASDHAIVSFNAHAAADDRVERVLLTVRDGMLVCRRRPCAGDGARR